MDNWVPEFELLFTVRVFHLQQPFLICQTISRESPPSSIPANASETLPKGGNLPLSRAPRVLIAAVAVVPEPSQGPTAPTCARLRPCCIPLIWAYSRPSHKSPMMRHKRPMRLPHIVALVSRFPSSFIILQSQQHRLLLFSSLPRTGSVRFSLHLCLVLFDPSSGHRLP
jgi:hypothetical protein